MYACVHICVYIICVTHIYIGTCTYLSLYIYIYIALSLYIYMYICICVCICMYVYAYIYIYISLSIYIYIYIYTGSRLARRGLPGSRRGAEGKGGKGQMITVNNKHINVIMMNINKLIDIMTSMNITHVINQHYLN